MTASDESLIEQVASAFRARDAFGRIRESPAFADLAEAERVQAHSLSVAQRKLEAALDPDGLSTTGKLVLARIRAAE